MEWRHDIEKLVVVRCSGMYRVLCNPEIHYTAPFTYIPGRPYRLFPQDFLLSAGHANSKALDKESFELQVVLYKGIRCKKFALG